VGDAPRIDARPDEDGHCTVCGLLWQEEGEEENAHVCPPGFLEPSTSPPVASPPASVDEIARAVDAVKFTIAHGVPAAGWRAHWQTLLDERAALLSARAAMAERVAGLEQKLKAAEATIDTFTRAQELYREAMDERNTFKNQARASEAEVARLREASVGLANCAYNLLQSGALTPPLSDILAECYQYWEAARAALRPETDAKVEG